MASKPGRPPTKGTRPRGNGAGYGGPAKGAGRVIPTIQTAPQWEPGQTGGGSVMEPTEWMRWKEVKLQRSYLIQAEAMEKAPDWGTRAQAADRLATRIEGAPVQRVINADLNEVSWFIQGAVEAPTQDAWAQRAKLLTDKPAGHGDD